MYVSCFFKEEKNNQINLFENYFLFVVEFSIYNNKLNGEDLPLKKYLQGTKDVNSMTPQKWRSY